MSDSGVTAEVTGRPKHFFSIHSKMQELGLSFEEIYDLVAFRIIVDTVRECYEALGVVHANWKPVPGPLQGLHRAAQGQHVPVAAYHRDRAARAADGSADSHARDAQGGRGRNRGALELQGRQLAGDQRTPSGSHGCGG